MRKETRQAPLDALRKAVLNAIAHRDYSNPAPIQIRVYDDRISLWNPGALPPNWTLDKLMGTHASAPHNPGIANAFFRAGMIEAWGRGIENIVVTCRAAGTTAPVWEVEPGGLRLDFVFTQVVEEPSSGDSNRVDEGSAQPESQLESQPESRPESQPESLAARVLQQLANGPMSKSELSLSLRQKRVSGQLNKVIRALMAEGHIGFTIPEKPRSQHQKYDLTDRGRGALDALTAKRTGTGA